MAASSFPILAGTQLVDDGTTRASTAVPVYDTNGNLYTGALKIKSSVISGTSGTLAGNIGLYFFTGTAAATYTLPAEASVVDGHITILNGGTSGLTIAPFAGELINGATNTVTVSTNVTGSAATAGKVFRADPSTNSGFLAT